MNPTTLTVCASCLEPRKVNDDGLCDRCALWDDSLDGTLLALINSGEDKDDAAAN